MKIPNKQLRADVVGSMLRPLFLLQAQQKAVNKKITHGRLVVAEDKAVKEAVAIQEKVGFNLVTDGEMRRPVFCHNFVQAVDGFQWGIPGNTVIWFNMKGEKVVDPVTVGVVNKIKKYMIYLLMNFHFSAVLQRNRLK